MQSIHTDKPYSLTAENKLQSYGITNRLYPVPATKPPITLEHGQCFNLPDFLDEVNAIGEILGRYPKDKKLPLMDCELPLVMKFFEHIRDDLILEGLQIRRNNGQVEISLGLKPRKAPL